MSEPSKPLEFVTSRNGVMPKEAKGYDYPQVAWTLSEYDTDCCGTAAFYGFSERHADLIPSEEIQKALDLTLKAKRNAAFRATFVTGVRKGSSAPTPRIMEEFIKYGFKAVGVFRNNYHMTKDPENNENTLVTVFYIKPELDKSSEHKELICA